MTSLAQQLQKLSVKSHQHRLVQGHSRASFLFDPKEAALFDRDTFFSIGRTGIEQLVQVDARFARFERSLFGDSSLVTERSVQSQDLNAQLDTEMAEFFILLSPYFQLRCSQKCLEWLLFRFYVNEYNAESLLSCGLPYYDTPLFVRILQLFRQFESPSCSWHWLYKIASQGALITIDGLRDRLFSDVAFFRFLDRILHQFLKLHVDNMPCLEIFLSFYSSLTIGGLEQLKRAYITPNEEICQLLLAQIGLLLQTVKSMNASQPNIQSVALMLISQFSSVSRIRKKTLRWFMNSLISLCSVDLNINSSSLLTCIAVLVETQNLKHLPSAFGNFDVIWVINNFTELGLVTKSPHFVRLYFQLLIENCQSWDISDAKVFLEEMVIPRDFLSILWRTIAEVYLVEHFIGQSNIGISQERKLVFTQLLSAIMKFSDDNQLSKLLAEINKPQTMTDLSAQLMKRSRSFSESFLPDQVDQMFNCALKDFGELLYGGCFSVDIPEQAQNEAFYVLALNSPLATKRLYAVKSLKIDSIDKARLLAPCLLDDDADVVLAALCAFSSFFDSHWPTGISKFASFANSDPSVASSLVFCIKHWFDLTSSENSCEIVATACLLFIKMYDGKLADLFLAPYNPSPTLELLFCCVVVGIDNANVRMHLWRAVEMQIADSNLKLDVTVLKSLVNSPLFSVKLLSLLCCSSFCGASFHHIMFFAKEFFGGIIQQEHARFAYCAIQTLAAVSFDMLVSSTVLNEQLKHDVYLVLELLLLAGMPDNCCDTPVESLEAAIRAAFKEIGASGNLNSTLWFFIILNLPANGLPEEWQSCLNDLNLFFPLTILFNALFLSETIDKYEHLSSICKQAIALFLDRQAATFVDKVQYLITFEYCTESTTKRNLALKLLCALLDTSRRYNKPGVRHLQSTQFLSSNALDLKSFSAKLYHANDSVLFALIAHGLAEQTSMAVLYGDALRRINALVFKAEQDELLLAKFISAVTNECVVSTDSDEIAILPSAFIDSSVYSALLLTAVESFIKRATVFSIAKIRYLGELCFQLLRIIEALERNVRSKESSFLSRLSALFQAIVDVNYVSQVNIGLHGSLKILINLIGIHDNEVLQIPSEKWTITKTMLDKASFLNVTLNVIRTDEFKCNSAFCLEILKYVLEKMLPPESFGKIALRNRQVIYKHLLFCLQQSSTIEVTNESDIGNQNMYESDVLIKKQALLLDHINMFRNVLTESLHRLPISGSLVSALLTEYGISVVSHQPSLSIKQRLRITHNDQSVSVAESAVIQPFELAKIRLLVQEVILHTEVFDDSDVVIPQLFLLVKRVSVEIKKMIANEESEGCQIGTASIDFFRIHHYDLLNLTLSCLCNILQHRQSVDVEGNVQCRPNVGIHLSVLMETLELKLPDSCMQQVMTCFGFIAQSNPDGSIRHLNVILNHCNNIGLLSGNSYGLQVLLTALDRIIPSILAAPDMTKFVELMQMFAEHFLRFASPVRLSVWSKLLLLIGPDHFVWLSTSIILKNFLCDSAQGQKMERSQGEVQADVVRASALQQVVDFCVCLFGQLSTYDQIANLSKLLCHLLLCVPTSWYPEDHVPTLANVKFAQLSKLVVDASFLSERQLRKYLYYVLVVAGNVLNGIAEVPDIRQTLRDVTELLEAVMEILVCAKQQSRRLAPRKNATRSADTASLSSESNVELYFDSVSKLLHLTLKRIRQLMPGIEELRVFYDVFEKAFKETSIIASISLEYLATVILDSRIFRHIREAEHSTNDALAAKRKKMQHSLEAFTGLLSNIVRNLTLAITQYEHQLNQSCQLYLAWNEKTLEKYNLPQLPALQSLSDNAAANDLSDAVITTDDSVSVNRLMLYQQSLFALEVLLHKLAKSKAGFEEILLLIDLAKQISERLFNVHLPALATIWGALLQMSNTENLSRLDTLLRALGSSSIHQIAAVISSVMLTVAHSTELLKERLLPSLTGLISAVDIGSQLCFHTDKSLADSANSLDDSANLLANAAVCYTEKLVQNLHSFLSPHIEVLVKSVTLWIVLLEETNNKINSNESSENRCSAIRRRAIGVSLLMAKRLPSRVLLPPMQKLVGNIYQSDQVVDWQLLPHLLNMVNEHFRSRDALSVANRTIQQSLYLFYNLLMQARSAHYYLFEKPHHYSQKNRIVERTGLSASQRACVVIIKPVYSASELREQRKMIQQANHVSESFFSEFEELLINGWIIVMLKCNEKTLRPLFHKTYVWAVEYLIEFHTVEKKSQDSSVVSKPPVDQLLIKMMESLGRLLPFYKLVYCMSSTLKHLFVSFAQYFVTNSLLMLEKHGDLISESDGFFQLNQIICLLLDTLTNVFFYDRPVSDLGVEPFLSRDRFSRLMPALVYQIEMVMKVQNIDLASSTKLESSLAGCLASLMASPSLDSGLWKPLNYQILLKTRSANAKTRLVALHVLQAIVEKVGEEYLSLLPETVSFLAELFEDDDQVVNQTVNVLLSDLERLLGEPIGQYL